MIDLFPEIIGKPYRTKSVFDLDDFDNELTDTQTKVWLTIRPGQTRKKTWFNFVRLHPAKPLPTICKASGNAKHCHWQYPKGMGIDGYKKGGSYPTEFKFPDNYGISKNQIGNSVPPLFMRAIASTIRHQMFDGKPLPDYGKMTYLEILESAWQDHLAPRDKTAPTVISTFAGGGGSSLGYSMAGYKKLLAVEWDNNAVATYRANFPDTPIYHGDIAKLSVEECMRLAGLTKEGELDLLDGSPPCFPAGFQIMTLHGKIPIEFCTADTQVLTHTGKFRKVINTMQKEYRGQIYSIKTKYGRKPVRCTSEHPFFARRKVMLKKDSATRKNSILYKSYLEPEWIAAKDLNVGDVVLEPHTKNVVSLNVPKVITKQRINIEGVSGKEKSEYRLIERDCNIDWATNKMAWILGFYLAEGHTRGRNPTLDTKGPYRREVIFSIADKETVFIVDKLLDVGLKPHAQKHSKSSTRVTVTSIDFWVLCNNTMGKYADGKFIPPTFMTMPVDWQESLLNGYFFGDGCISQDKRNKTVQQKATTVSWELATGIAKLIAKVHRLVASIDVLYPAGKTEIEGRTVNVKEAYSVGFTLLTSTRTRPGFVDEYGAWLPIKSIKELPTEQTKVYNLEVEEDHSYTVNDFAVRNCQGISSAGKRILDDPRNQLYKQYVRLLRGLKPKVFVMENVSGMVKGKMKLLFAEIMRELKASGYQVRCKLMNTMYFHVPQSRERLIWIGVRNDLVDGAKVKVSFPKVESRPVMVREAFHGITNKTFPPLDLTVPFSYVLSDKSVYQCCPEHILKKYFPRMINNRKFNYSSYAKRRSWLKPSCTIEKTYKDVCPIHPLENRHFTIEELKRIVSFPDAYHLDLLKKFKKQWALLGNSVPPLFMRAIANHIRQEILLNIKTSRRRDVTIT